MDREEFLQRYKDGQRDFSNLDLRKINLNGYTDENDLSGCNFTNSDLRQADLTRCNLSSVDFTDARLEWTYFHGAKIDSKTILSSKYLLAWQLIEDGVFEDGIPIFYQFRPNENNSKDFRFQDLSYTNLNIADLRNLDFTGANFSQSSLQETDLSNVNLSRANLEKAYLHLATLKGSIIDEKTKLDDKWRLVWELVNEGGQNRNLEGVDLSYANLSDADLTGINLKNANLTQANLSRCNLTNANLRGANLKETKFRHTILIDTILIDVKIENTKFYQCTVFDTIINNIHYALGQQVKIFNQKNNEQYIHLNKIDLEGCNLSNFTLVGYNFSQCILRNVNFKNSNLSECNFSQSKLGEYWTSPYNSISGQGDKYPAADFSYAILTDTIFSEADLNHVNFSGANLQNANLTNANLSNADLTGADLRGADLENAKLDYVNLRATIIDDSTKISEKWRFIWKFINSDYPKKINLKGVDFSYIKLEYFDFSGCDLIEINLSHAILNNCNFSDTFFSKANLSNINLEESNLANSVFVDSVIASAYWKDNHCQNIKFNNCNLVKARLSNNYFRKANFNNCMLDNSALGCSQLKDAVFNDCILLNTSMYSSDLTNVNFTGSNLQGARLTNTILKNTDFTGANLENVIFVQELNLFGEKDEYDMEKEIEKAIIHNTNLKGTIFENKFTDKKQEKSQDYSLLVSLQKDFIHRIQTGHLLNCDLIGYHSELTIIEGDKLERLRDYCWEMVSKFRNHRLEPRKIFINNLTGKLGEEVVKNRLGDLVNTVDYEIYDRGDGGIDLTLRNNDNLGIQVKTRTGDNINDIQWKITRKEIETNIALVCIYSQEKVTEAQLQYHLILAGFMPTNEIKNKENEVFLGIKELFYGGGLKGYLESYINES